jgi:hypothetical protein
VASSLMALAQPAPSRRVLCLHHRTARALDASTACGGTGAVGGRADLATAAAALLVDPASPAPPPAQPS